MEIGIVGLPNTGKSTLFNALLSRQIANVAPYPFCTIEPNVGVVEVPDERLGVLAKIARTTKIVPPVVKFVDIAGLVAGAHKGEGLGNQFLAHIREVDAICHILRAFEDENVARSGSVDPKSDYEVVKTELCLADLQTLEKQKPVNPSAPKEEQEKWKIVEIFRRGLSGGKPIKELVLSDEEKEVAAKEFFLLTAKPDLFVLNIEEKDIALSYEQLIKKWGLEGFSEVIPICAKIEMELAELSLEERKQYLKELGLKEGGLERLIKAGFVALGLQTFLTTTGGKEVKAWTIPIGTNAQKAAGMIHTDFERGFIKAQICSFEDFVRHGGWTGVGKAGKARFEGKDYILQEGEVVEFKFNV